MEPFSALTSPFATLTGSASGVFTSQTCVVFSGRGVLRGSVGAIRLVAHNARACAGGTDANDIAFSGSAKVTSHGEERTTLGPGAYFGEVALIDDGPRTATVTAVGDVKAHVLVAWDFRPMVKEDPELAWGLLQGVAQMLRAREGF